MEEKNLKNVMYALIAVAVVLAGALAYIWYQKTSLVNELSIDKENLTREMIELQNDYATLSSDYDTINSQLDSSREEVSQLIERIKKTEATNRSMMRKYEKELGTLRSIMKTYIVQIDSLNTLNKRLTADAAAARREAAESRKHSEKLSKEVEELAGQVAAGAVIKARGLKLEAYIRVKSPDGILLVNSTQKTFEVNGEPMICSASREVDYQGRDVELGIYLNEIPEFVKGIYTVEAFTTQGRLGSAELMLR